MEEKTYTAKYLVKTLVLVILLGLESFFLADAIHKYASSGSFLEISSEQLVPIVLGMLALVYTYALTVGAWKKNEQFLIVPVPLAVGVLLRAYFENPQYAATMSLFVYLLVTYDIHIATRLKSLLIRFDPVLILKLSARGMLLSYCFVGAFFVMYSTPHGEDFNLVAKIGETVSQKADTFLKPELSDNPVPESILNLFSSIDPMQTSLTIKPAMFELNIKEKINQKVGEVIRPYVFLIKPLMSLLVFGMLQLLAFIVGIIFTLTIRPVFYLAKRVRFFEIVTEDIKREILKF